MTPAPSRPRVAFVTHGGSPDLTADDRLAAAALEELGVTIEAVPWGQPGVDWLAYAAIVLRSTWDYHLKLGEFLLWVDRLDALDAPLWNPPPLLRWNCRKEYLLTITHPHLRPPPTHFVIPGATTSLAEVLDTRHWDEVVIKPSVSADALDTLESSRARAEADQAVFEGMLERTAVVVQPLVPEIRTQGELSLVFFDGVFSHAVRKRPKPGEFRVQERLGGTIAPAEVPGSLVEWAGELLASLPALSLYARVDVVEARDRFVLMEVELVEPSLFLEHAPAAARAFAAAVHRKVV